jgi:signal transduction histidine kinase
MKLSRKILLYFSSVVIVLLGFALLFIYTLFSNYREEEYQQREREKIERTLEYLSLTREIDKEITESLDRKTIEAMFNEKILIYNRHKSLIYSSIDDTDIPYSEEILAELSPNEQWIDKKDGLYDVVGIYFESPKGSYYGISKSFDAFGYSKLDYLRNILILSFFAISLMVVLVSFFISRKITGPLAQITERIVAYDIDKESDPVLVKHSREMDLLVSRFNELMVRLREAFAFQQHAVHHLSHELKTPIAVLVSNFERIEKEADPEKVKAMIRNQKEDTANLAGMINSLLELSKSEKGELQKEMKRMDEIIFDVTSELSLLYPDFCFSVEYELNGGNEKNLSAPVNVRLVKSAMSNLMVNCVHYSSNGKASIFLRPQTAGLRIDFCNSGTAISESERQYLFRHFFRGENSRGKKGFGLGLVFAHKIIVRHGGTVEYDSDAQLKENKFSVVLPLV